MSWIYSPGRPGKTFVFGKQAATSRGVSQSSCTVLQHATLLFLLIKHVKTKQPTKATKSLASLIHMYYDTNEKKHELLKRHLLPFQYHTIRQIHNSRERRNTISNLIDLFHILFVTRN